MRTSLYLAFLLAAAQSPLAVAQADLTSKQKLGADKARSLYACYHFYTQFATSAKEDAKREMAEKRATAFLLQATAVAVAVDPNPDPTDVRSTKQLYAAGKAEYQKYFDKALQSQSQNERNGEILAFVSNCNKEMIPFP